MRLNKKTSGLMKVTFVVVVSVFLSACTRLPLTSRPEAEQWASHAFDDIRATYPELAGANKDIELQDSCLYEELFDGSAGTSDITAEVPMGVDEARTLLRRIGDDYERMGWEVWGEGDYDPPERDRDNRELFPKDAAGHPSIALEYDSNTEALAIQVTSACFRTDS